jgi:DNA-binding transcriptional ArsR family regulator
VSINGEQDFAKAGMIYNQIVISLNSYTTGMDAFYAIADPTRRAMLDMLAKRSRSAGDIVNAFRKISQPAVSKHLRILKDAGLVSVQVHAQQRIYSLEPKALAELDAWIAKYKVFWSDSLGALEQHLDKSKGTKKK